MYPLLQRELQLTQKFDGKLKFLSPCNDARRGTGLAEAFKEVHLCDNFTGKMPRFCCERESRKFHLSETASHSLSQYEQNLQCYADIASRGGS